MGAREIISQAAQAGLDGEVVARLEQTLVPRMDAYLQTVPAGPPEPDDDAELIAGFIQVFQPCLAELMLALPNLTASAQASIDAMFDTPPFQDPARARAGLRLREALGTLTGLFDGRLEDLAVPNTDGLALPNADEIRDLPVGLRRYFRVGMLVTVAIERVGGPLQSFTEWAWSAAVEAAKLRPFMAKYANSLRRPFDRATSSPGFRNPDQSPDLRVVAQSLAVAHHATDDELVRVLMVPPTEHDDEIRLLEITGSVGTTNEILPFTFAPQPDKGWSVAMSVVLVSQDEFDDLLAGELELPEDWGAVEDLEEVRFDGQERR